MQKITSSSKTPWTIAVVFGIVLVMWLTLLAPIMTIQVPQAKIVDPKSHLGYWWSNLIWLAPALVMGIFLLSIKTPLGKRKAVVSSLLVLPMTGFLLDLFFADRFFTFPNADSICGVYILGFDFKTLSFSSKLPIEEFIFYLSGFIYNMTAYIFSDKFWLSKYTIDDSQKIEFSRSRKKYPIFKTSAVFFAFIALGLLLHAFFKPRNGVALPEYYLFLVLFGIAPVIFLFPLVYRQINWQAISFVMLSVFVFSVIWEVTMGIPYGWWGYHKEVMIGLFIFPWFDLPLESVLVWIIVTFTTVSVLEAFQLYFTLKEEKAKHRS